MRRFFLALSFASALLGCQQQAPYPQDANKKTAPETVMEQKSDEPIPDDSAGEMPANWIEADGPGASTIFVEDQGQTMSLECSRKDSPAATSPGKILASATWRSDESPPKSQDVGLYTQGGSYSAAPIWARDTGRDSVSIQLEPTPELLNDLMTGDRFRIMAGDWFLAVGPDSKGIMKRFAQACRAYISAK